MPVGSVRFVHAGQFRLEQPGRGLAEVPEHLVDLLIDAPYRAAEQVFETVLARQADFLVLCGDLVDPARAGPRGPLFLIEQFRRLAEHGIAVYWAGGVTDPPDAWPAGLPLPENVHVFPQRRVEEFVFERAGEPLVRITGMSSASGAGPDWATFEPDPAGLPTVAVAYAPGDDLPPVTRSDIAYWALGGRLDARTLEASLRRIHWPGSPQGRSPRELGPHGCTLVSVDRAGEVLLEPVATDKVRWLHERVELDRFEGIDRQGWREAVEGELCRRMEALQAAHAQLDLIIHWQLAGGGALARWLAGSGVAAELLASLRSRYGCTAPAAWSAALLVEPSAAWPEECLRAEGVRADYLKIAQRWRLRPEEPLGLEAYLPAEFPAGMESPAGVADAALRERIVCQAALFGARLLSGEEEMP